MSKTIGQRALHNARLKKKQKADVTGLFERALMLHKSGLLPDAKAVYRQLLRLAPNHFNALYLLGRLELGAQSYREAELLLRQAVEADPRSAEAHMHRGVVLNALQRFDEARASYQQAVALNPSYAVGWNNLGNVCLSLNRGEEAIGSYDRAIACKPDFAEAHYNRGLALAALTRHAEALDSFDRALAVNSQYRDAWNSRGIALSELGRLTEAIESYDKVLAIDPDSVQALNNRGNAQSALARPREALDSYDRALAIDPRFAEAHNGRGAALIALRGYDEAMVSFERALAIVPDHADALTNRAAVLIALGRPEEALADFDRALVIAPASADAWTGQANALLRTKRISDALASCERALAIDPDSHRAHALLGQCLGAVGEIDAAMASFDRALAIKPDFEDAITVKIFTMDFVPTADFVQHRDARAVWWDQIGARIAARPHEPHRNRRDPERRLVLGYVSSDFRQHSASLAFKPALQHCDKSQFEIVCYSCFPLEDGVTQEFRHLADRWRDAAQWSDDRLAAQIRADEVDILIDLSGHTTGNRLGVFARKPAPVQVHGWGHVTPPGLPTIDYVFADPIVLPAPIRHLFEETIYDLPCMLTADPLPSDVPRSPPPALASGSITFGVFNRISKITDASAATWGRILSAVPRSRLLIKHFALDDPFVRDRLLARFARYGAPTDRIDFLGSTSRAEHLAALNDVDICFDPFPTNGGASTWEALQMGVPVIALLGDCLTARAAGSIVASVGLQDWVAENEEAYFGIAVERAARISELDELRRALPARIAASAAGNPVLYGKAVANAYRTMWRTYCARAD